MIHQSQSTEKDSRFARGWVPGRMRGYFWGSEGPVKVKKTKNAVIVPSINCYFLHSRGVDYNLQVAPKCLTSLDNILLKINNPNGLSVLLSIPLSVHKKPFLIYTDLWRHHLTDLNSIFVKRSIVPTYLFCVYSLFVLPYHLPGMEHQPSVTLGGPLRPQNIAEITRFS